MKRIAPLFVLVLLLTSPLHARQEPPRVAAPAAQDEFVPVNAPLNAQDAMPAPRLVAIAYGFIWIVLFGYLWSIRSRLAAVEREMDLVGRRVASGRNQP
jgi:CcmD family protein